MTAFRPMPQFTGDEVLKLFRGDELLGTITNLDMDWPWMIGVIALTDSAKPYLHIWYFLTDPDKNQSEPPFEIPADIEENWFVSDEKGERSQICFPAVYEDGDVWWRDY